MPRRQAIIMILEKVKTRQGGNRDALPLAAARRRASRSGL